MDFVKFIFLMLSIILLVSGCTNGNEVHQVMLDNEIEGHQVIIGAEIEQAFNSEEWVGVIVIIKNNFENESEELSREEIILNNQNDILDKLNSASVKNVNKYELTNAFYAQIRKDALEQLKSDNHVEKIEYDLSDNIY